MQRAVPVQAQAAAVEPGCPWTNRGPRAGQAMCGCPMICIACRCRRAVQVHRAPSEKCPGYSGSRHVRMFLRILRRSCMALRRRLAIFFAGRRRPRIAWAWRRRRARTRSDPDVLEPVITYLYLARTMPCPRPQGHP